VGGKVDGLRALADQMAYIADHPGDTEACHGEGDDRLLMVLSLLAEDTECQAEVVRLIEAWGRIEKWYA
jgi:hypothetical protein